MIPTSVLIVEDLATTLEWLCDIVAELFPDTPVRTAETLGDARALYARENFDLMLVDLGMPDGSGLDLISEVRASKKDAPYIVVTTILDDDEHLRRALRAGANGYLLKDDSREDMLSNLRNLTQNRPPVSTRSLNQILGQYHPGEGSTVALSAREEEVLQLIAKGYKVTEVADSLELAVNTVKGYLKTIYSKLEISSRAEATAEAVRRNLIDP